VVAYEAKLMYRRRKFYGALFISLTPPLVLALISCFLNVKALILGMVGKDLADRVWAMFYGIELVKPSLIQLTGLAGPLLTVLVGSLTASDSLPSEFKEGSIILLLSKPLSRLELIVGKLIVIYLALLLTYFIGLTACWLEACLLIGKQGGFTEAILTALAASFSAFSWALMTFAISSFVRNSSLSVLLTLLIYLGGSMISILMTLPSGLKYPPSPACMVRVKYKNYLPWEVVSNLPQYVYEYFSGGKVKVIPSLSFLYAHDPLPILLPRYLLQLSLTVGIPKDRILCVNGLRVPFTTRLLIVGKYGSSGLEGFKEGKGAWIRVELKPSKGVKKRITLSLPFTYNKRAKLTVEGEFELTSIQYPSWVKVGELFYLEE